MYLQVKLSHLLIAGLAIGLLVAVSSLLAQPRPLAPPVVRYEGVELRPGPDGALISAGGSRIMVDKKGNITIEAAKDLTLKADGVLRIAAGTDLDLSAKRDVKVDADRNASVETDSALTLKAKTKAELESGTQMTMKAGANLDARATSVCTVKAQTIKLN